MTDRSTRQSPSTSLSRADFLRHGMKSAAGFLGTLIDTLFGDNLDGLARMFPTYIRPPGAIAEGTFLETCTRCGACVTACRFFAIRRVLTPGSFDEGTPFLLLRDTHCRLCEDTPCTAACKSGALRASDPGKSPCIGFADVSVKTCLRSAGSSCTLCRDACPDTYSAISFTDTISPPVVDAAKCTGCGACEAACIVRPEPAITIVPSNRS
ncbi:4Fe-4S binding protein [Candidatus Ozemobacteraceae bacterium]|nr:4Fe-4S binding protein [Candidatus Ozemobacteraceae bacterium]